MRKETREAIGSLKTQMLEAAATLTSEEREEFYNEVNEWTYEKYESKAERDRSFKRLLKDKNVISD